MIQLPPNASCEETVAAVSVLFVSLTSQLLESYQQVYWYETTQCLEWWNMVYVFYIYITKQKYICNPVLIKYFLLFRSLNLIIISPDMSEKQFA